MNEEKIGLRMSEDIRKQLVIRNNALISAKVLVDMAQRENDLFIKEQFKLLGLDDKKNYNLDLKTGEIFIMKKEIIKKSKNEEENKK